MVIGMLLVLLIEDYRVASSRKIQICSLRGIPDRTL
jgi:hypothetical protein